MSGYALGGLGSDHDDIGAAIDEPGELLLSHVVSPDDDAAPASEVEVNGIICRQTCLLTQSRRAVPSAFGSPEGWMRVDGPRMVP